MEEGQKGSRGLPRPGREREAPAGLCLKTRSASIPAHSLQGHAGLWDGRQGKEAVPSLGSALGEQTKESHRRDFPGDPVVKILSFH